MTHLSVCVSVSHSQMLFWSLGLCGISCVSSLMAHFESNDKDKGAHFRFDNGLIHVKTSNINLLHLHHTSPMQYKQDYFISFLTIILSNSFCPWTSLMLGTGWLCMTLWRCNSRDDKMIMCNYFLGKCLTRERPEKSHHVWYLLARGGKITWNGFCRNHSQHRLLHFVQPHFILRNC